jgi:putative two-component system response regulator
MTQNIEEQYKKEINAPFEDSLTGLFNFGFFQLSLNREIHRSNRYGKPFTLAFIDIDNFTEYNQQHGSLKADLMLKEIGRIIKKNIRQTDLAARKANDEFAVIQVECNPEDAAVTMERIADEVKLMSRKNLSVSIGIATYHPNSVTMEGLKENAKSALHRAQFDLLRDVYFFNEEEKKVEKQKPKVLIVDDDAVTFAIMEQILSPLDYEVLKAVSGEEALALVSRNDIDLILLDVMMPEGIDGYEVCRRLKSKDETRMIPIIIVTVLENSEDKIASIESGADDFITKPPDCVELRTRAKSLIKVKRLNQNMINIENLLISLANMVEAKDAYTDGHIKRVASLGQDLGKRLGLSAHQLEALKLGGILHDIGKLSVPGEILNKPSPLSHNERELMKNHASIGHKLCLPLKGPLGAALDIIRHHHEKLNGSGYPDGLVGDEISMPTRIMAVVDIYDALVTERPYRKAMSKEKALTILREEADKGELDANVVNALEKLVCSQIYPTYRQDTPPAKKQFK